MHEQEIENLEHRIEELIRVVESLRQENSLLRDTQNNLMAERAKLVEKTEEARQRVEAMISRLKTLEQEQ